MSQQLAERVDDRSFSARVLEPRRPTLVLFTARYCLSCGFLTQRLPELASELCGMIAVVCCPTETSPRTAHRYDVVRTPTLLFFGGRCARLTEKGVGWVADQSLRMLLAAKLADTLVALQVRFPTLTVHRIEPRPDGLPMFLHHMMSFSARRELIEYGYACGRRAAGERLGRVRDVGSARGAVAADLLAVRRSAGAEGPSQ